MNSSLRPPDFKSGFLVVLAMGIASQVPITLSEVSNPIIRALLQGSFLVLAIGLAWKAKPPVEHEPMPRQSDPGVPITTPETPEAKKSSINE